MAKMSGSDLQFGGFLVIILGFAAMAGGGFWGLDWVAGLGTLIFAAGIYLVLMGRDEKKKETTKRHKKR